MITCSVIGPKGYTGLELTKILLRHPKVEIAYLVSRGAKSELLKKYLPKVRGASKLRIASANLTQVAEESDVVFLALPHREPMRYVDRLLKSWPVVIDLSGDFRFKQANVYEKWYGVKHKAKHLLSKSVYGISELNAGKISKANLIANPGCYPTGAILGIAPLLAAGLIKKDKITIDAKSGVSGAGKKAVTENKWDKGNENFKAYKVNQHQHAPEITEHLTALTKKQVKINFVPHLLPIFRGLLSTIYLDVNKGVTLTQVKKAFSKFYKGKKFIRIKKDGVFPEVGDVVHTNYCDIGFTLDKKTNRLIVITAIDNLVKGASGQAVQNMNIAFGLPEGMGLR